MSGMTAQTRLFGVFGDPVYHSLSPCMQNAAFQATGMNAVYLAFHVTDLEKAVAGIRGLNVQGVSVTIPHKSDVMGYLDAIDPKAAAIGAVNTIVNHHGWLTGYNTDCEGAIHALSAQCVIKGRRVVMAGAGGAAKAIGFGVIKAGGQLTVCSHLPDEAVVLAGVLGCGSAHLDAAPDLPMDIFINATPLGMVPDILTTPLPGEALKPGMTVMDCVYHPLETRLLREAAAAGCQCIDGTAMFVHQGAAQFRLWTGVDAPADVMRAAVKDALTG
ncbi:MAG: shikimate dehydrogenase [Deltaproteobacteria bacterium]|nr:MAG: shikimate dehydrogenase [Deltaproteobacteria bacterium]